jgi:hypothetical protein
MDLQHCRIQKWPNKWACKKICINSLPGCIKEIVEDSHRPAPTFRLTTPPSHNLIHAIHPSWKNCHFRRYSGYNEGGGRERAWPEGGRGAVRGGGQGQGVQYCTYKLNVYNWEGGGGRPASIQSVGFYILRKYRYICAPPTVHREKK